jgi:hypothetical protein
MAKVKVTAKPDFLQSVSAAKPVPALSELIWNGFDAGASRVNVTFDESDMHGVAAVRVHDTGDGLDPARVDAFFGDLGQSWKARQKKATGGRALHGKRGRGRFKAFALGKHVTWNSSFQASDGLVSVIVRGDSDSLESFDFTSTVANAGSMPGTEVVVETLASGTQSLRGDAALLALTRSFAPYLTDYPGVELWVDGRRVDPAVVQNGTYKYSIRPITLASGEAINVDLRVVEWSVPIDRTFQLCDEDGFSLHELPVGRRIKAPGYHFTLYLSSQHFREMDDAGELALSEMHSDVQTILQAVKEEVTDHFRRRHVEDHKDKIERWKAADIYPYSSPVPHRGTELVERQVFHILASQVEDHLPSFDTSDVASRRLMFKLLAQAIGDNPESVRIILNEVLSLGNEEREDLATLLKKTSLSRIISSATVVAGRIDFVEALSDLLFNKVTKKKLLERDQLHKILESEAWLFREDFQLAGSEKRLEQVLAIHLNELGKRADDDAGVRMEGDKGGRVDLMLSKALRPTQNRFEYLVVELKRPRQRITSEVMTQIEAYALAVAQDPRFHQANNKWTFIVVGNEMDPHASRKARQKNRPEGLIFDDEELNVTVWAYTWAELLDGARARLSFFAQQLSYEADADSSSSYLRKAHAKYLPDEIIDELV